MFDSLVGKSKNWNSLKKEWLGWWVGSTFKQINKQAKHVISPYCVWICCLLWHRMGVFYSSIDEMGQHKLWKITKIQSTLTLCIYVNFYSMGDSQKWDVGKDLFHFTGGKAEAGTAQRGHMALGWQAWLVHNTALFILLLSSALITRIPES